jgi:hypothetical protein
LTVIDETWGTSAFARSATAGAARACAGLGSVRVATSGAASRVGAARVGDLSFAALRVGLGLGVGVEGARVAVFVSGDAGRAGAAERRDGMAVWSDWRVTVPDRLKFWSSRGPTVSVWFVAAGAGESWACAGAPSVSPATAIAMPQRLTAFMTPRPDGEPRP